MRLKLLQTMRIEFLQKKEKNMQSAKIASECTICIRFFEKFLGEVPGPPTQLWSDIPSRTNTAAPLQDWSTTFSAPSFLIRHWQCNVYFLMQFY